jgi:hypothetical protein
MGTSFCSTLTTCTSNGAGAVEEAEGRVQPASHNAPVNTRATRNAEILGLRIVSLSFHKEPAGCPVQFQISASYNTADRAHFRQRGNSSREKLCRHEGIRPGTSLSQLTKEFHHELQEQISTIFGRGATVRLGERLDHF